LHQPVHVPAALPRRSALNEILSNERRPGPVGRGVSFLTAMTDVLLRSAKAGDIPEITRIYAHAVRHGTASFELDAPDIAEMMRRYQALAAGGFPYLVAQSAGELLGYAYVAAYRARPAYRWTVEDSIYVAPHAHRRGVGSALLRRLIEACETNGYRQMIAVIGDTANASSIELHR